MSQQKYNSYMQQSNYNLETSQNQAFNDDALSEGTEMYENFLDNIGKALDDEPLDDAAQRRSK